MSDETASKDAPTEEPVAETPEAVTETVTETPETPAAQPAADEQLPAEEVPETHEHVAIRDFAARFMHQILSFKKGDVIDKHIGADLRSKGAPIKLVEKATEENKGEL